MEQIRKEDHTENGWTTLSNGVRKPLYTGFMELHKLETSGLLLSRRLQVSTGVDPMVMMMMMMNSHNVQSYDTEIKWNKCSWCTEEVKAEFHR